MQTSRLARSTHATLRDITALREYCAKHDIPYSNDFFQTILPTDDLQKLFDGTYTLTPLPHTALKQSGASTVLVFESKEDKSNHGDVVSSIAQTVGNSLVPKVDTLYVHTSLNPNYRAAFDKDLVDPIKTLVENQGVPVLHTSIGWDDALLDFNAGHDDQANHLWRVTAFVVDSAGNDGKIGTDETHKAPYQKHNAVTHFAPLVVHVGAAAMDEKGEWCIEGYSSANSPTFLAPVASRTYVHWHEGKGPQALTGTSAAAPYASGVLAALNSRYGQYLTREQILYAVLATCTPIKHVNAFAGKTPEAHDISYEKNAAGRLYNPEYGGFGLIHAMNADKLLAHMVALTQAQPDHITIPTEDRITLLSDDVTSKPDKDGLYHYPVTMPAGIALKTTIEADFGKDYGNITITSPSGTTLPMVMSKLASKKNNFGMSTCHGWAGENLKGTWIINSTTPIERLRLAQHHFLEKDIVRDLDVPKLLAAPTPDLEHAAPLQELKPELAQRVLNMRTFPESAEPRGLRIGATDEKTPILGDTAATIAQLKILPSGFTTRHRHTISPGFKLDENSAAGKYEREAIELVKTITTASNAERDAIRTRVIEKQLAAIEEYKKAGKEAEQIIPLGNVAYNYISLDNPLAADGMLNVEKAIPFYKKALLISEKASFHHKAYEISCNLYSALCECCRQGKSNEYGSQLETVRKKTVQLARLQQGPVDNEAHRIEEGEYGFSNDEKIGTDNISQCLALIVQDPVSLKTGIAHIDNENDLRSLDSFFAQFSKNRLHIRLVGARFDADYRTNENISAVMEYLSHINADIISTDIYGGNEGPSAVTVNPISFALEEKSPGIRNANEAASNALLLLTRKGKPLISQFDFTASRERSAIHLNTRMLSELRAHYFDRKEWDMEHYLHTQDVYDRPLMIAHLQGLEQAYNREWDALSTALEAAIDAHHITGAAAQQAREALLAQTLFVGENAHAANAPLYHWIEYQLFVDNTLQRTALKGPMAERNQYDPPAAPPQTEAVRGLA